MPLVDASVHDAWLKSACQKHDVGSTPLGVGNGILVFFFLSQRKHLQHGRWGQDCRKAAIDFDVPN